MAEFIVFTNRADFNAFNTQLNTKLGLPRVGVRFSDNVPQPDKQQTINYTAPITHPDSNAPTPDNRILAAIDSDADATDRLGKDVVDEVEAKKRGFLSEPDTPATPTPSPSPTPSSGPNPRVD